MNVAFLGLGAIGRPMAARIAPRHRLTVWNRTSRRATEFASAVPCQVAPTAAAAVSEAEVVITCLSTSRDVDDLLHGPTKMAAALRSGTLFLDCTSGDPATSQALEGAMARRQVAFADCPVSGGTNGAEAGTLTVMVGALPEVFARARPILECFGKLIVHVGPVGAGDTIKAINQVLLAANILTLGEALTAMVKAGVPARAGIEILNASSGRSFVSETLVPSRVLTGAWPSTFRLALLDKDVGIALDLIRQLGLDAPVLESVAAGTAAARQELGDAADYLEPIKLNERRAGVEVRG